MQRVLAWVFVPIVFVASGCENQLPPRVALVDHVEGLGIWRDEVSVIRVTAPGADSVVYHFAGESRTVSGAPFELDVSVLPNGAVPFVVEAHFPSGEVLSLSSGAYVKDPANACRVDDFIDSPNRAHLESIISNRTDAIWAPRAAPELRPEVVLTPLDDETYAESREQTISILSKVDERFLNRTDSIYLVQRIQFEGTFIGGLNDPGGRQIAVIGRTNNREQFTHTLISENATLQSDPRFAQGEAGTQWDSTNPNGYSSLTFEEYLESGSSRSLIDIDVELLKSDNFVNAYAARNRNEDLSQFVSALFLHPDEMMYFSTTIPHTDEKLQVYNQMFSDANMGIEYVECLAHER